ncbi:MAG: hypothetical protein LUG49_02615 [Oscillospiraceae bacterium]|nr:hypothetical protein [Oscillospiraceae bacterium]
MKKRALCILTALMMVFCLSSSYFAGTIATADENYLELPASGYLEDGGYYRLDSDVTNKSALGVKSGTEVTIDLNGHSLSSESTNVILISGGTLNLIDSSSDGGGSLVQTTNTTNTYAIKISNGGTLNMSGGTVSGSYGIYSNSTGCNINITGGKVVGTEHAAIYNTNGTITVSGTTPVEISALTTKSVTEAHGIYCASGNVLSITNPNAYVCTKSTASSAKAIFKSSLANATITAGYYSTDVTSYVPEGYECVDSGNSDYPYVVKAKTLMPEYYGNSLTLDGEVGVTYYFDMTGQENPDIYTLQVQIEGEEETRTVAAIEPKTVDGLYCYRYTVYVNPDQFGSTIYATLTDGTNSSETIEYSVETYCMHAISTEGWEPEAELCKALLNYGYYASLYTGTECTNSLSDVSGWTDPVVGEWTADLSGYSGTGTEGVSKALILGSSVVIRLYIEKGTTEISDVLTFGDAVLERHSVTDENYEYYVEFKVPAKDMVNTQTVLKNGEEFTSYSVLSYVYNALKSDETAENLSNLCKAIYYYSVVAYNYNGWR